MESWVKKAVSEYCELHFNQIAKRAIQTELEGLLSKKKDSLKKTHKAVALSLLRLVMKLARF